MAGEQIKSVPGTEDVLPRQWGWWRLLYGEAIRLFGVYGYGEIRTPVIEFARLFIKGTGETTDIVEKQMYILDGGGERPLTLRPEGTPPVVRAYLAGNLDKEERFQKFYYMGPMFRKERPQKGRLRQFHQIGVEAIGGASPLLDAETLMLAVDICRAVGLTKFEVALNSIGCEKCRSQFRKDIREMLSRQEEQICGDCRRRVDRNVLRVFDCKNEPCAEVASNLPTMTDYLCEECRSHYGGVKRTLEDAGLAFTEDPHLMRGLDYYTNTVYEIKHKGLGARDAICGGGRYDTLVEQLGGPRVPCVGFAIGVEASILAMESELGAPPDSGAGPLVYAVSFEESARAECFRLVQELREKGIRVEMDFEGRSAKAQMRKANKLGCPLCLLVGPEEIETGQVLVREMSGGEQFSVPRQKVVAEAGRLLENHTR